MRKVNKGLLFCAVLFLTVIVGMSVYAAYPDMQMKCYLNKRDYEKAVKLYNDKQAELENFLQYEESFQEHVKKIKSDWKEEELSYKEAVILLEQIEKINQKSIASEATRMKDFILAQGQGKDCYYEAEVFLNEEKYEDALKQIAQIDNSYLEYAKVEALQELCVIAILEQTMSLDSVEEYETWIEKLASYHEIVPEAAFLTRQAQMEQEVSVFKDVISIIKEVADSYGQEKYKDAFSKLEAGLEKYPDYGKMTESYEHYHSEYVSMIRSEVEELCEKEEYNRALDIVENAKDAHDCEEFHELTEYVKEEKSILYKWKNNIVDFFDKLRK